MAEIALAGTANGTSGVTDEAVPTDVVMATGPIAYWPMDDGSGTVITEIVAGRNMTIAAGSWSELGPNGPSYNCTGGAGVGATYTGTIDTLNTVGLSWAIWVCPITLSNYNVIVAANSWSAANMHSAADGTVYAGTNATRFQVAGLLKNGTWTHLCYTQTAAGVSKLYANGVQVAAATHPRPTIDAAGWGAVSGPFLAQHDAIWGRALTPAEVVLLARRNHMAITFPVTATSAGSATVHGTLTLASDLQVSLYGVGIGLTPSVGYPTPTLESTDTVTSGVFDPETDTRPHPVGIASTLTLGTLSVNNPLGLATASGVATATAAMTRDPALRGTPAGVATAAAPLRVARPVAGEAHGVATCAADVTVVTSAVGLEPEPIVGAGDAGGDLSRHMLKGSAISAAAAVSGRLDIPVLRPRTAVGFATVPNARLTWTGLLRGGAAGAAWPTGRLSYLQSLGDQNVNGESSVAVSQLDAVNMHGRSSGVAAVQPHLSWVGGILIGYPAGGSAVTGTSRRRRDIDGAPQGVAELRAYLWVVPQDSFANVIGRAEVDVQQIGVLRTSEAHAGGTSTVNARISSARRIGRGTSQGSATVAGVATYGTAGWVLARSTARAQMSANRAIRGQQITGVATVPGRNLTRVAFYGDPAGTAVIVARLVEAVTMRGTPAGAVTLRTLYDNGTLSTAGKVDLTELPPGRFWAQRIQGASSVSSPDLGKWVWTIIQAPTWVAAAVDVTASIATWVTAGQTGEEPPSEPFQEGDFLTAVPIGDRVRPIRRQRTYHL